MGVISCYPLYLFPKKEKGCRCYQGRKSSAQYQALVRAHFRTLYTTIMYVCMYVCMYGYVILSL